MAPRGPGLLPSAHPMSTPLQLAALGCDDIGLEAVAEDVTLRWPGDLAHQARP
jgi:hypothetical protein